MKYGFLGKGKALFYLAGVICVLSIFLSPVGILFFYMAHAANITIDENAFTYRMMRKRVIPFASITSLTLGRPQRPACRVDGLGNISFAEVIPLTVQYGGKKVRLSLNFFEYPGGVIEKLRNGTGLVVNNETGEEIPF